MSVCACVARNRNRTVHALKLEDPLFASTFSLFFFLGADLVLFWFGLVGRLRLLI